LAQPDTTSSVTLRDYANVIWRRKWLVVIVACTLTAFLVEHAAMVASGIKGGLQAHAAARGCDGRVRQALRLPVI